MDKILISNSFKNLLQSLGAKTSDPNKSYAVPVVTAGSGTTAGTPQGYMDMASLASVLGGVTSDISSITQLNDCVTPGTYYVNNVPTTGEGASPYAYGRLRVSVYGTGSLKRVLHEMFYFNGDLVKESVRSMTFSSGTWSAWKEIANA